MWWHIKIKRKYIYVFQLLSPFFTLYKILCVLYVCERECVCYESLMSITMVQCSIKVKSKGQQTCYKKNSQNVTVLSKFGLLANTICSIFLSEWFPLWFPVWGLSHGADYASLSREMLRGFIKKQKKGTRIQMCLQKTLSVWPFHSV